MRYADADHHGNGVAHVQRVDQLFERPQLFYHPDKPEGAWVEIPIEVKRKEPLRLLIQCGVRSGLWGAYQASLDGVRARRRVGFLFRTI